MGVTPSQIDRAVAISKACGATRLILFGSVLERPDEARDIDLACDGIPGWEIFRLAPELERALETPVDLIPLSPPSRSTRSVERSGKVLL
jgi:predicted nucleotidyltransferase